MDIPEVFLEFVNSYTAKANEILNLEELELKQKIELQHLNETTQASKETHEKFKILCEEYNELTCRLDSCTRIAVDFDTAIYLPYLSFDYDNNLFEESESKTESKSSIQENVEFKNSNQATSSIVVENDEYVHEFSLISKVMKDNLEKIAVKRKKIQEIYETAVNDIQKIAQHPGIKNLNLNNTDTENLSSKESTITPERKQNMSRKIQNIKTQYQNIKNIKKQYIAFTKQIELYTDVTKTYKAKISKLFDI